MNFAIEDSPLADTSLTREKMERWVESIKKGEKPDVDVYGKPTEQQLKELENIRNLSKEMQDNLEELETYVRLTDEENQAMNPTAPILDYSEDHEFMPTNQMDGYYATEDQEDAKEEQKQQLTKGKARKTEMQQFYKDQCLFLTGGTGFLGKVLIEKLLRSCGDLDTIYVLIRNKKGQDAKVRLHQLLDDPLYERVHKENPKAVYKVIPIVGDMTLPGLGLSLEDRKMLTSKVAIIINGAATVRFDEKLSVAAAINVQGTREVIQLAKECRNLKAFTHVSTAFANTHVKYVEEKFYEPPMMYDALAAVADVDEDLLESLTPKLLGDRPNTYCFTKAIAEETIRRYGEGMPVCIVRPSIVVSTYEEPIRGWTDNAYGPTGIMVGTGTGVLRTMLMDVNKVADMVPVDLTVNSLLASAWHTAKHFKDNQTSHIPIYNFVSGAQNPLTWRDFIEMNRKHGIDKPTTKAIWYYGLHPTKSYTLFLIYNFFLHFVPALLIDTYFSLVGKPRTMIALYNKVMRVANILFYFSTQDWRFSDQAVRDMWNSLSDADKVVFPFNIGDISWEYHAETFLVGLRVYLVKDDLSTLPEARKKWNRLYYLHQMLKAVILFVLLNIAYLLYKTVLRLA